MRKILVILALAGIIAGCGDPPPKEGYVRDKRFTPAHWEDGYRTEYYEDCGYESQYNFSTEKYEMVWDCHQESRQVYESHHHWAHDDWDLYLEDCKTTDEGKRKCRRGWVDVTEATYERYAIGQHYPDAA